MGNDVRAPQVRSSGEVRRSAGLPVGRSFRRPVRGSLRRRSVGPSGQLGRSVEACAGGKSQCDVSWDRAVVYCRVDGSDLINVSD